MSGAQLSNVIGTLDRAVEGIRKWADLVTPSSKSDRIVEKDTTFSVFMFSKLDRVGEPDRVGSPT